MTSRRARRLTRLGVGGGALVLVALATTAGAAPPDSVPDEPTIEVVDQPFPDDPVAPGGTFKVQGAGWPADILIQLEVCGSEARNGTSDCALESAQVVASNSQGEFRGRLSIVVPPSPCPCVIRAVSQSTTDRATVPVEIPDAPTEHPGDGEVVAPVLRRLEVEHVELLGDDDWRTWLGAPPKRTFEFEVINTGNVPVTDAVVAISAGPSDDPTGFVPPVRLDTVDVGERRKVSVPIEFGALSWGEQTVRATINGTSVPVSFSATTTTYPWLLIIIPAILVLQALLLFIRNIVRRRLHARDAEVPVVVDPDAPPDDALIFVVEMTRSVPAAERVENGPDVRHETMVIRSIATVQQLVLDALHVDEAPVTAESAVTDTAVMAAEPASEPDAAPPDDEAADDEAVADDVAVDDEVADDTAVDDDVVDEQAAEAVEEALAAVESTEQSIDEHVDEPVVPPVDVPVAAAAPTCTTINTITVLADADSRLGDAYRACDLLCTWVEDAYAESDHPASRALTLRRHQSGAASSGAAPASGLGMVPMAVLVRAPHVRTMT